VEPLDDILDRLETLDDAGDDDGLRAALAQAMERYPDAPELREWRAAVAAGEGRFTDALALLDDLLASDPDRDWARRERAAVLLDLGRVEEALGALRALRRPPDRLDRASIEHDIGLCLDRLGRAAEADRAFGRATALAPEEFPRPLRLAEPEFESLVADALDDVPDEFARQLSQVVVRVRDYPAPGEDPLLLGLYVGVARMERTLATEDHLDHVVVFKRPHELRCADTDALRDDVRHTVLHELAHHFGVPHERMGEHR
jgi:predicted Zn-dependent protease with MMP-like domain